VRVGVRGSHNSNPQRRRRANQREGGKQTARVPTTAPNNSARGKSGNDGPARLEASKQKQKENGKRESDEGASGRARGRV